MNIHKPALLGVNIDHIATLRQARGTRYPDPVLGALLAEQAGADGITLHLREDRRHIQDTDVIALKERLQTRMNLEMAATEEMLAFAGQIKPEHCCLVPEKREELTTEGGLDVVTHFAHISAVVKQLNALNIEVSLFIDARDEQIAASFESGASTIELHTGEYADCETPKAQAVLLDKLTESAKLAHEMGLVVNAGHGLHYHNVKPIAQIPYINELNIGHAIIAHSVFVGMKEAVREMKALL